MATVSILLTQRDGTRRADMTSIKWAWFDQTTPNTFAAPTDTGSAEITDAFGVLEITLVSSTLVAGQYGCLALSTSDGIDTGLYKLKVR